ncbi:MAG: hypothetical protein AB9922_08055 [Bacteroidales bacterium]
MFGISFFRRALLIFMVLLPVQMFGQDDFETEVKWAVRWQMQYYSKSRLIDLYKNFFQDKFGPGYMVTDTASAGAYLRRELGEVRGPSQVQSAEKTGWEGRYVRVDLAVIKQRIVSYRDFFDIFLQSIESATAPDIESWRTEWKEIEKIIHKLYPRLLYFEDDSKTIDSLLTAGKYVVHHSEIYTATYKPHYRLIDASLLPDLFKVE